MITPTHLRDENRVLAQDELKRCRVCLEIKSRSSFMTAAGVVKYPSCSECRSQDQKSYLESHPVIASRRYTKEQTRHNLVQSVTNDMMKRGCADCSKYIPDAMEFDHTCLPEEKSFEISMIHKAANVDKDFSSVLHAELAKGEYVCSNCHRLRTLARNPSQRVYFRSNKESTLVNDRAKLAYSILSESSCIDCGNNNLFLLEFDHVRGSKIANISHMIRDRRNFTLSQVKEEIDKCDVRCVNCHNVVTASRKQGERVSEQEAKIRVTVKCNCGNRKSKEAKTCITCSKQSRLEEQNTRFGEVSKLVEMIQAFGWEQTSRQFEVSSNSLRKYLRRHSIDVSSTKRV